MNPSENPQDRAVSCRRLALTTGIMGLLSLGLTGCFRVSSDAQTLRDSVMKSAGAEWEEKIEFGVGAFTLSLARAGLAFVNLDPEARTVLDAVRGAEIGVYEWHGRRKTLDRSAALSAADRAMGDHGWDRVVGVMDGGEFVAVYVPRKAASARNLKVCVVVLNGREMVVASARSNLEPLMEIAFSHAGRRPLDGRSDRD